VHRERSVEGVRSTPTVLLHRGARGVDDHVLELGAMPFRWMRERRVPVA
jgi:hypothetical protein